MFRYSICFIIGILLYILLNRRNGFSVGIPVMDLKEIFPDDKYPDKITDDTIDPFGEGIPREFYKQGLRLGPKSSRVSKLYDVGWYYTLDLEGPHQIKGMMFKKGEHYGASWKSRFFRLGGDNLLYYKTKENLEKKGEINMSMVQDVRLSGEEVPEGQVGIEIVTEDRTYRLSCQNEDEAMNWIGELTKAMDFYSNSNHRIFISAINIPILKTIITKIKGRDHDTRRPKTREVPIPTYIDYNMHEYQRELIINGKKYHIGTPGQKIKGDYRLYNQDNALVIIDLNDNIVVDALNLRQLEPDHPPPAGAMAGGAAM